MSLWLAESTSDIPKNLSGRRTSIEKGKGRVHCLDNLVQINANTDKFAFI